MPRLSAERCQNFGCGSGEDYNAENATVIGFFSTNRMEDKRYNHLGLVKAPDVQAEVLERLGLTSQAIVGSSEQQNREKIMRVVTRDSNGGTNMPSYEYKAHSGKSIAQLRPPLGEGYYVTISGVDKLNITDDEGNTNTDIGDMGFERAVPGVSYGGGLYSDDVNVGYHDLSMPADEGEYTIKFRTGTDSVDIEVLKGVGNTSPNLAIRYIDLDLPQNVECLMTFSPAGVPDLKYDADGDGTYETVVPAHVRVSGAAAQDVTPPTVSIDTNRLRLRHVYITATDNQSGVGTIYYRFGTSGPFQVYTGPVSLPVFQRTVEAFADDNVGNRSSPVSATRQ